MGGVGVGQLGWGLGARVEAGTATHGSNAGDTAMYAPSRLDRMHGWCVKRPSAYGCRPPYGLVRSASSSLMRVCWLLAVWDTDCPSATRL